MIIAIIIIVLCIIIDQTTKIIARKIFKNKKDKSILKGFINLSYLENSGGAMGRFSGSLWLLIISTLFSLLLCLIFFKYYDLEKNILYSISLSVFVGGVIGNLIDRIFYGFVTDFIYLKIYYKKNKIKTTPVFNLADLFIFSSVILLLISVLFF